MVTQAKNVTAKVVNGINVDDLAVLIDSVKKDAEKGKTNWHVTTIWEGQTRSRAQVEGFEIGGKKCRDGSRSRLMNHASSAARTVSPIRRST
jgi:hypothetical protein